MSTPESPRAANHDENTAEMTSQDTPKLASQSEQMRPSHDAPDRAVDAGDSDTAPLPAESPLEPRLTRSGTMLSATVPEPPTDASPESPGITPPSKSVGGAPPPSNAPSAPKPRSTASHVPFVPAVPEAPRTRWGGIIWGLVFLALAGVGFWSTTALSADFLADIWLRITPLAVGAGMVLIVGGIAMLCALVALARHLQRRSAAQRSPL